MVAAPTGRVAAVKGGSPASSSVPAEFRSDGPHAGLPDLGYERDSRPVGQMYVGRRFERDQVGALSNRDPSDVIASKCGRAARCRRVDGLARRHVHLAHS